MPEDVESLKRELRSAREENNNLQRDLRRLHSQMDTMKQRHTWEIESLQNELVIARDRILGEMNQKKSKGFDELHAVVAVETQDASCCSPRDTETTTKVASNGFCPVRCSSRETRERNSSCVCQRSANAGLAPAAQYAFTQEQFNDACWDVLNSVPGAIAFYCSTSELIITKATKKAYKIWGSAKLCQKNLHSLVKTPSRAADLGNCLDGSVRFARGNNDAKVVDFGCMELTSGSGRTCDCALTAVVLPKREGSSSDIHAIVFVERLENVNFGAKGQPEQREEKDRKVRRGQGTCRSAVYESLSDHTSKLSMHWSAVSN